MHKLLDAIYFKSPDAIQNLLISVYGFKLYRERYIGNHKLYLAQLLKSQFYDAAAISGLTINKLQETVRFACNNVPFYQELYKKNKITNYISALTDINCLPIISKDLLRQFPEKFLAKGVPQKNIISINSSGTTGKTLKIFVDYDSRRFSYAFYSRLKQWAGIDCRLPNVTFAGRTIVAPDRNRPPFWRTNLKMNNYLFSSYHLSPENLGSYVRKLQEIQPHFIDSYPSSLFTLATFMLANNIAGISPKAIITSSETLFDFQRKVIEDAFGCPVFDQYGCAEQVVFISQCERGSYHIHPEYGLVEFLRDDGSTASPGEEARLICTGFTNRAMPLIRYDIGDTGILSKEQHCPCGRNFPVVEKIVGRTDDIIVMRDGRRVGRLDPIFKGLQSIKETQIIQEDLDNITLKIVPGENFQGNELDVIVYELKKRLGNKVEVATQIVSAIPRTTAGKFRAVISKVKKAS